MQKQEMEESTKVTKRILYLKKKNKNIIDSEIREKIF